MAAHAGFGHRAGDRADPVAVQPVLCHVADPVVAPGKQDLRGGGEVVREFRSAPPRGKAVPEQGDPDPQAALAAEVDELYPRREADPERRVRAADPGLRTPGHRAGLPRLSQGTL